ncbi:rho GTPase-activating protein 30 [Cheilinus undulatus]|uniref:rho GTPase-activating protein 30 n=1 Tax=Cheilinus undulatus TaxID=241271 RepID=UPI001BD66789|nr:rho GTPase-activating protein 30 [Cheilinus undulatus]XP_041658236.1 rho GTPase-activating protein 30 [Cheilinus undulatus]XP_041658237.1 rho GTPase-activating protein 30 [Cheilinus undulatus]
MRRNRRKGGNKEKVFGCDLLDHLNASSQEIPLVLRCCSEFVEKNGIVDGIYRLSGVSSNIQKLRGEFEGDGSPDLNKDVYLQDIHCVSSLCKAYFRELPNPLLTYQLYDKFAEAVAIQLEEERLVKINDVLKELPTPHYRTLEFLMRHLVRMASYSSETNMHARNLAIVWAPNLLRSKDIEVSGFNGTAAFMEVRVQSIVVEFILTHVAQLFPAQGVSSERRNSLPSPTAASCRGEGFFKSASTQPVPNFGNISPGDGPLPIRPYHAIIEGTDKRKGSLKGRKWMSIFNIGGRLPDPRRRHKHSAKEKDRSSLRPARSMDSLSTSPYPNEGSKRPSQRPPSTSSPPATASTTPSSDVTVTTPAVSGSEYAVTYRRGTGLVSGGAGTQGTYTSLDPEGLGVIGSENLQSRSPGLSTKVGRRAAMHITGPTLVTVPLHITSNLALGVLQRGGADRVIHRGREKDGGDRVEGKEGGERKESVVMERKKGKDKKVEEENNHSEAVEADGKTEEGGGDDEEGGEEKKEEKEEVREKYKRDPELLMRSRSVSREKRTKSVTSNKDEGHDEDAAGEEDIDYDDEYMDMKDVMEVTHQGEVFDTSDVLNSTEMEGDDLGLSGYVQDNFEFLDQMDCGVLDHMDCGAPYQVNEFSVEPPGHSDDEYEVMEQYHSSDYLSEEQHSGPEAQTQSPAELNKHRPLSMDSYSRQAKSCSLPYMTSPVRGAEDSSSEEVEEDDSDAYSSEDDENMFTQSLPSDYFLDGLTGFQPGAGRTDRNNDGITEHQEERDSPSANAEFSARKESTAEEQKQVEGEDAAQLEEEDVTEEEEEVHGGKDGQEHKRQRKASEKDHCVVEDTQSEQQPLSLEVSTCLCSEDPVQSSEELDNLDVVTVKEKETVDDPHSDYPAFTDSSVKVEETNATLEEFVDFSVSTTEEPRTHDRGGSDEEEDREMFVGILESDGCTREETIMHNHEEMDEREHEGKMEEDGEERETESWDTLEDVVDGGKKNETEVSIETETTIEKLQDLEEQQHSDDLDKAIQEMFVVSKEAQQRGRENVISEQKEEENESNMRAGEQRIRIQSLDKDFKEVRLNTKALREAKTHEMSDSSKGGVGSKVVVSKQPKFYQVKAVPVVPPKPQHCKITAMTIKHQQLQRERRDAERGRENTAKVCAGGPEKEEDDEESEEEGRKEKPELRGGERERRRDVDEGFPNRNSPLSMNFEEAVAIATMRRGKEKECEKERQRDWGNEVQ